MKKLTTIILTLLMMLTLTSPAAFAATKSSALKEARKHVPSGCVLIDTDKEGSYYEFEFRNKKKTKDYTILISSNNKLMVKEMERRDMDGGASYKISASTAKAKVKATYNATIVSCTKYKDDGKVYAVAFKGSNYIGYAEVNASNNVIVESKKVYKRSGTNLITPAKAKSILMKKAPSGAKLVSIDLEYDSKHKRFVYELTAVKGKYEYEIEINAKTGKVIEFEKDTI